MWAQMLLPTASYYFKSLQSQIRDKIICSPRRGMVWSVCCPKHTQTVRNPAFCQSVSHLEVIYGGMASGVCSRGGWGWGGGGVGYRRWDSRLPWPLLPGSVELKDQKVSEYSDFGATFSEMPGIFQRESFSTNLEILLR